MKTRITQKLAWFWLLGIGLVLGTGDAWAQFSFGGGGGRSTTRRSNQSSYPSSTEMGEAMISSDLETRKLIVVTDDATAEYISQVVSNLDRPAPQVLIKVVFLEVTHRKGSDIGVEGQFQRNISGTTIARVGQAFNGMPGITSGDGLYSIAGSDYDVTLRAIAEAGKLEVLSRPSILARNNQQAIINVGQQVPLITSVRYDTFGNQINGITYQDVGIILRVTPFITSDELVEMIVSPEISNLSDSTVSVATGTNTVGASIINRRSADTVVVTRDGETVIIGGLIQNSKTESVTKVPLLGDVPLLGFFFRRKVTGDAKTELLIFITPHIVKHPAQLAGLTATEKDRAKSARKAFTEEELSRFLDDLPAKDQIPPPSTKNTK